MGNDPSTSVLNKNCQAHDVKNVFVADGGPFVSQARQELHVDDPRARDADGRVHRGAAEGRDAISSLPASSFQLESRSRDGRSGTASR